MILPLTLQSLATLVPLFGAGPQHSSAQEQEYKNRIREIFPNIGPGENTYCVIYTLLEKGTSLHHTRREQFFLDIVAVVADRAIVEARDYPEYHGLEKRTRRGERALAECAHLQTKEGDARREGLAFVQKARDILYEWWNHQARSQEAFDEFDYQVHQITKLYFPGSTWFEAYGWDVEVDLAYTHDIHKR